MSQGPAAASKAEAPSRRARSHEQIVRVAARLLREQGLDGAPVDEVMAAAGLTRGGFYAHFADKTEMFVEAIDLAFAQAKRNLFGGEPMDGEAWLARANARYLSEAHVAEIGGGCAITALGAQIPRAAPRIRDAFNRNARDIIDLVAAKLGDGQATDATRAAAGRILAHWVGTLTLARALGGATAPMLEAGRAAVMSLANFRASADRRVTPERARRKSAAPPAAKAARAAVPKGRSSVSSPKSAPNKAGSTRSQP